MPYTGADDPKLPANVQKMSAADRRRWVGAWNGSYGDCDGDPKDCESRAFAIANAAVKEIGVTTTTEPTADDKHYGGDSMMVAPEAMLMFGGATTWEQFDRYEKAAETEQAVSDVLGIFDGLLYNIRNDERLTVEQKASAIETAAAGLRGRVEHARLMEGHRGARELTDGMMFEERPVGAPLGLRAFKDTTGQWRWVAVHTNRYRDREKETFSEASHKDFVQWVDATKNYPVLRPWHVPVDLGRADFLDYDDGFMISTGTFYKGFEDAAERLSRMPNLGCSHGYVYRPSDLVDGVYHAYRSFEVTVLPVTAAANELTSFGTGAKEAPMDPVKREWLKGVLGEDRLAGVDDAVERMRKAADEHGLSYKDVAGAVFFKDGEHEAEPDPAAPTAPATTEAPAAAAAAAAEADAGAEAPAAVSGTDPEAAAAAAADDEPSEVPAAEASREIDPAAADPSDVKSAPDPAAALGQMISNAVESALAPLAERVDALAASNKAIGDEIVKMAKSDDDRLADRIRPRVGPNARGQAASESDGTIVAAAEGERVKAAAGTDDRATRPPAEATILPYVTDFLQRGPLGAAAE